ncbi:MAG: apolipoprotein N-acyltransferase [Alphaproteobacteria bacterium]|nr:apolipoprotein N-acyltransferase [Alphaproteobacteria bacterium]
MTTNETAGWSAPHRWIAAQDGWRGHALSFSAGALATLGFAPFHMQPAFFAAITFLVWQLDVASEKPRRRRAAFARGFWFGLGQFSVGLHWVYFAFQVDAETFAALAVPAVLALAAILAFFWGAAFALAIGFWRRDWRRIGVFAIAAGLAEVGRGVLFGGLPWNLAGYIWTAGAPVSQLASTIGIYGLTALTLLVAASPATLTDARPGAMRFAPFFAALLGVGLAWGAGLQRLGQAVEAAPGSRPIVRVVDPGLSEAEKWENRPDQELRVLAMLAAASGDPDENRANVVVWPEGAIPALNSFLLDDARLQQAIGEALGDRALVIGFSRYAFNGADEPVFYNSAAVLDGVSGRLRLPDAAQIYDKHRLVPFGEFIPLYSLIEWANIKPVARIGRGFRAGPAPRRLIVPDAPPVVALICYEAIFTGLTPRGADRPGWIASLSNDAWFGGGTGPQQHYTMTRYRAIEEGLPIARAASGGVSAIIDSYGRPVAETSKGVYFAEAALPSALPATYYTKFGHLTAPLVFFLILALLGTPFGITRRTGTSGHE